MLSAAAGDIDLDGDIDLVMTDASNIYIYTNNGRAEFTLWKTYPSLGSSTIVLGVIKR